MASRKPLTERNYSSAAGNGKGTKKKGRYNKQEIIQDYNNLFLPQSPPVPMTEDDLINPVADKINQFYLAILNTILTESTDSFKQSAFISDQCAHPEILEDSVFYLQFVRVMKRLLESCNIHDFSLYDLTFPDSKRTMKVLQNLFNLIKFSNVFYGCEASAVISEETESLKQKLSETKIKIKANRKHLKALQKQRAEEKEIEQDLKQAIRVQEQEVYSAHQQREMAVKQYQSLQETHEKEEKKQQVLEKECSHWEQRVDDLKAQIVTSPEKLRASLKQLKKQVEEHKLINSQTKSDLIKWESIVSTAHHIPPVIKGLNEDLGTLTDKVAEKSEWQMKLDSSEELASRLKQSLRELSGKHQNLKRRLKLVEEELRHAQYDSQHKHPRHNHFEKLAEDVELLQQQLREKEKKDSASVADTAAIKAQIVSVRERFEKECADLDEHVSNLQARFDVQVEEWFSAVRPMTGDLMKRKQASSDLV